MTKEFTYKFPDVGTSKLPDYSGREYTVGDGLTFVDKTKCTLDPTHAYLHIVREKGGIFGCPFRDLSIGSTGSWVPRPWFGLLKSKHGGIEGVYNAFHKPNIQESICGLIDVATGTQNQYKVKLCYENHLYPQLLLELPADKSPTGKVKRTPLFDVNRQLAIAVHIQCMLFAREEPLVVIDEPFLAFDNYDHWLSKYIIGSLITDISVRNKQIVVMTSTPSAPLYGILNSNEFSDGIDSIRASMK